MSIFSDQWAAASVNVDVFYGEAFTYQPMTHVGGRWIVDPARAAALIVAALDEAAVLSDPLGKRAAANTVSPDASTHAIIDLASTALAYPCKAKDRLQRASDSSWFEVSGVLQDNLARIGLRVVRLGPAV